MSAENLNFLIDMGFNEAVCKKALNISNDNVQEALEWLLAHGNEASSAATTSQPPVETSTATNTLKLSTSVTDDQEKSKEAESNESAANLQVNSLKCDDCGMQLKDEDFATLHAHKTGHVNFSQSTDNLKPKTKEEIEEQKKRLSEKLEKIRKEKQEREAKEAIELEKSRRKQGREINEIKQKFHEDELKRIAEEKRREKLADAAYKQKLKEDIARDREAQKRAREEAQNKSGPPPPVQPVVPPPVVHEKKDYDECKIQVRLTDGKTMVHTFKAKEQLAAVRLWIEMNRTDGPGKFNLLQTFPRKVYNEDDMMRSLVDLGLVPASSIVIAKAN